MMPQRGIYDRKLIIHPMISAHANAGYLAVAALTIIDASLQRLLHLVQCVHGLSYLRLHGISRLFVGPSWSEHRSRIGQTRSGRSVDGCRILGVGDASFRGRLGMSRHLVQRHRLIMFAHLPQVKDLHYRLGEYVSKCRYATSTASC